MRGRERVDGETHDRRDHPRLSRRRRAELHRARPARRGSELSQWADVEAATKDALHAAGGTITHHHSIGRDHRRWYDRQRPDPFGLALGAAKTALDPAGILNPGVLVRQALGPGPTES